jgi:hypothetical protein
MNIIMDSAMHQSTMRGGGDKMVLGIEWCLQDFSFDHMSPSEQEKIGGDPPRVLLRREVTQNNTTGRSHR